MLKVHAKLALHTKHARHSWAPAVNRKSSKSSANVNSFTGDPACAFSGSSLFTCWPVSTFCVLPLVVNSPEKPDTNFWPLRELSVASMIAVNRPMTTGTAVKTIRSDVMLGPLKHVFSTHLQSAETR